MVMGSPTSLLLTLTGGELIYIQLKKKHKCMADEQTDQASNKRDITKNKTKQTNKQTKSLGDGQHLLLLLLW